MRRCDDVRKALLDWPTIHPHAEGGYVWTSCVTCGPDVHVDDEGCCLGCGHDALWYGRAPEPTATRPKIGCLCGSTRFPAAWVRATRERSLAGEIVLSVGVMIHAGAEPIRDEGPVKAALDELHLRKIDLADYVLVLCPGGYIGASTRREIDYAELCGKTVEYDYRPVEPSAESEESCVYCDHNESCHVFLHARQPA
jgi:hypothetical protein